MAVQPTNPIILIASDDVNLPSTGQPNKTEPASAIQTTGWDDNQVVTAENLNYIFDNFGEWLTYLKLSKEELESTTLTAGDGLTGGGDLTADRTFTLGTPSILNGSTTNNVTASSHTHALDMASQAEAEAGLNNTKLVTPLRVHEAVPFTFSPSSVGGATNSVTLPNGLIMKWGDITATADSLSAGGQTVTFPTPFPNQCLNVQVTSYTTRLEAIEAWCSERTASNFKYRNWNTSFDGTYFAIGY